MIEESDEKDINDDNPKTQTGTHSTNLHMKFHENITYIGSTVCCFKVLQKYGLQSNA